VQCSVCTGLTGSDIFCPVDYFLRHSASHTDVHEGEHLEDGEREERGRKEKEGRRTEREEKRREDEVEAVDIRSVRRQRQSMCLMYIGRGHWRRRFYSLNHGKAISTIRGVTNGVYCGSLVPASVTGMSDLHLAAASPYRDWTL
jgi:hypothetical protein